MHTVTKSAVDAPPQQTRLWFGVVFITVVVLANLCALGAAWQDKSWGAYLIATLGGPILNGVFALTGLVAMPFLRRRRSQFSVGRHLALSLGVPIAAIAIDAGVIFSMSLHGC